MTDKPTTIIEAKENTVWNQLSSLRNYNALYRYLFKFITERKIKETILGWWWLILRPLIPALTSCVFFMIIAPMETEIPYPIMMLTGYLIWNYFAAFLLLAPRCMRWTRSLMKKMYFPRVLVPMAAFGVPLIEFAVVVIVLAGVVFYYYSADGIMYITLNSNALWIPVLFLYASMFGLAFAMVAAITALVARDVIYTMPYIAQLGMLLTPVIYPLDRLVPPDWHWLVYCINPMAVVVEGFKFSLLGTGTFAPIYMIPSFIMIVLTLIVSFLYFTRAESIILDDI